jgi:ATP-dependent Clp protease adaptor protein ClpS
MGTQRQGNLDEDIDLQDEVQEPKLYKVLLHNDDYSPMDFVILVLKKFFSKNETEAYKIMLDVHQQGVGVAGIYSYEVAETKVMHVNQFSKSSQHPLKASFEEES